MNQELAVRATIRLLPTRESGRTPPIRSGYRPNHNFFGPENRDMAVGPIDMPDGTELKPGESADLTVRFQIVPEFRDQIYAGREWRIQEGGKLVGIGTILDIRSPREELDS